MLIYIEKKEEGRDQLTFLWFSGDHQPAKTSFFVLGATLLRTTCIYLSYPKSIVVSFHFDSLWRESNECGPSSP